MRDTTSRVQGKKSCRLIWLASRCTLGNKSAPKERDWKDMPIFQDLSTSLKSLHEGEWSGLPDSSPLTYYPVNNTCINEIHAGDVIHLSRHASLPSSIIDQSKIEADG